MTPKEKAKELVDAFYETSRIAMSGASTIFRGTAKASAKRCCEEVLKALDCDWDDYDYEVLITNRYWREVLQEIEKL